MSKREDGKSRGQHALEFKLEAVRLVKGDQSVSVTVTILGVPSQPPTPSSVWLPAVGNGRLIGWQISV